MVADSSNTPRWIAGVEPAAELRAQNMTGLFEKECREQPERLADLIRGYRQNDAIREQLRLITQDTESPAPVLFIGMGASFCSSIPGSLWLQSHGRSSFFVDAGEWLHYSLPTWNQAARSILITTSGESAELVQLCKENPQSPVALICNNEKSTCWSLAKIRLPILAGPEYGNATKTYSNATAACIILASELLKRDWHCDAHQVLDSYRTGLNRIFDLRQELARFCAGSTTVELIGRGPSYGGALMGALCIREMAGLRATAHSGAGFRHGPLLDVDESHLAIIFALGRAAELGVKLAQDCNARGGKVILVSTEDHPPTPKLLPVNVPLVPEPWESLTSVLIPQALTLAIIEKSGPKLSPRFEYGTMTE
jgi:glucosamine--fructose-6-phosphate aminotransferase (isomerizing)